MYPAEFSQLEKTSAQSSPRPPHPAHPGGRVHTGCKCPAAGHWACLVHVSAGYRSSRGKERDEELKLLSGLLQNKQDKQNKDTPSLPGFLLGKPGIQMESSSTTVMLSKVNTAP